MANSNNAAVPNTEGAVVIKKKKAKGSSLAKFTYHIALLCLIAGLALPLNFEFGSYLDNTLFWQLPAAVNVVFGKQILTFGAPVFAASHPVEIWGALKFDLGAYLTLLYALITVIGIIMLIFVLASKKASSALGKASFIEGFALLFLLPLFYIQLLYACSFGSLYSWKTFAPLFIALGGTLLIVLVQAFAYKKGSGFMKLIMFLFSGIALVGCIYPVNLLVPALEKPLQSFSDLLGDKFTALGLYGAQGNYGIGFVNALFHYNFWEALGEAELMDKVLAISALALALLALINFTLDALGLAKKTKKYMLTFNVIRYLLEIFALAAVVGLAFYRKQTIGVTLIILAVLALLQFIINCIRVSSYTKRRKAELAQQRKQQKIERQQQLYGRTPTKGYTGDAAAANNYFQTAEERRAAAQAAREQRQKERQEQRDKAKAERDAKLKAEQAPAAANTEEFYNVTQIYKGPTDEFIKELTNDEKIEFAKVFLERRDDVMSEIPEYIIGGNNDKFFSSIFIYYGRICGRISGTLMNKIYECGYRK